MMESLGEVLFVSAFIALYATLLLYAVGYAIHLSRQSNKTPPEERPKTDGVQPNVRFTPNVGDSADATKNRKDKEKWIAQMQCKSSRPPSPQSRQ